MKMKLIPLSLLLFAISACASMGSKDSTLQLMDGSILFTNGGNAVRMVDSNGETVAVKKGTIELADGSVIYIKRNGEVRKLTSDTHSDTHNSKRSSGHSH